MRSAAFATTSALCGALLALSSCTTVGPDYRVPEQAVINVPAAQGNFVYVSSSFDEESPLPDNWWQLYDDERLNRLVKQALTANADLRVAAANLRKAQALQTEIGARSGFHEQVDLGVRRAQESGQQFLIDQKLPVVNEDNAGFSISYDLDLFGKLRRAEEAAEAQTEMMQAALDLARVNVAAETVRAYLQQCSAEREMSVAQRQLDLQLRSVEVTQKLVDAGRANHNDVLRAQSQTDIQKSLLPAFQEEKETALLKLSVLTGKTPREVLSTGDARCSGDPHLKQTFPVGNGATLLKRRPDVREAERHLAASTAKIGVATAALYPDIVLGATAGFAGLLKDLSSPSTNLWNFGGLISWTIPDSGARARIKGAEAETDAALAHFDGVVLTALKEVETALVRYVQDLKKEEALKEARHRAQQAAEENELFYKAGRVPYITSLDANRTLASVDAALAASDARILQDQVALFMALGGGWEQAPSVEAIEVKTQR